MNRIYSFVSLLALGLLLAPGTVSATPTTDAPNPDDRVKEVRIQQQMLQLLTSEDARRQEQALRIVTHYAHVDTFSTGFYRPITPHLARIAARDETEALSIMAVSGLATIGTPDALRRLARITPEMTSPRVQRVARRVLAHYAEPQ